MQRSAGALALALTACAGSGAKSPIGDTDATPPVAGTPAGAVTGTPGATPGGSTPTEVAWVAHRIGSPEGPAFTTVADVDGDGTLDLVVSRFGTIGLNVPGGAVELWRRDGAGLDAWSMTEIVSPSDGIEFPNHTTVADLDGDADLDVIVPSGFLVCAAIPWTGDCGGLAWFEQTPAGWVRHTVFDLEPAFTHHTALADIDGDGIDDLFTVAEVINAFGPDSASPRWYQGTTGPDRFDPAPRVIPGDALGSFPTVLDVDGDGDDDVASAEFAVAGGSFAWLERTANPDVANPAGTWVRRVIADDVGPSIQLQFIPNLYGDGRLMAVGTNHTNTAMANPDPWESAALVFEIPATPTGPWPKHFASDGIVSVPGSVAAPQAAPGVFGHGDLDGDGDVDLAVAGDGDPRVFWMEQLSPGAWTTHVLHPDLPQAGGMSVADLDDDGAVEIVVTGYEDNALFVLERQ